MTVIGLHSDLLTPAEAAQMVRVSEKTLAQWRSQRKGPPFVKMSGRIRYFRGDVEDWLKAQRVDPESPESYPQLKRSHGRP